MVVVGPRGREKWGLLFNGYGVLFWEQIFWSALCKLSILSICAPQTESDCFEHTTTGSRKGNGPWAGGSKRCQ